MQMGAEYSDVKNTQVRRITAERLLQSKTTIPHYYLTVDLNADRLLELRGQLNEKLAASGGKLSVNDFIVKASALVRAPRQSLDLLDGHLSCVRAPVASETLLKNPQTFYVRE